MLPNPFLYYRTLRHLKPSQIYWRLRNRTLSYFEAHPHFSGAYAQKSPVREPANLKLRNPWRENPEERPWRGDYRFCFLNREVDTEGSWFTKGVSALWMFNLHYHHFLFGLEKEDVCRLISSWLNEVTPAHRTAWHPYVISERLCSWIWVLSPMWSELDERFRERVIDSIYNQTRYLARHLEYDLLANHLLVDAKGLVIAGLFLGVDEFVERGLAIYEEQLPEQILSYGGHFERSPMYHSLILEDLLCVTYGLGTSDDYVLDAEFFLPYIEKMGRFLAAICIGDEIPLLNDSVHGVALNPGILIREVEELCARSVQPTSGWSGLEETGLYVYRGEPFSVLFDAGAPGPEYQMGHGHNDALSFLVWIGDQAFITDSGVYEYEEGARRTYSRSARAHNVAWVPPHEPGELWKSFRVGAVMSPYNVRFDSQTGEVKASIVVPSIKRDITRQVKVCDGGTKISITDLFTNHGIVEGNLHFAPSALLAVRDVTATNTFTFRLSSFRASVSLKGSSELRSSVYFKEFGLCIDRPSIRYRNTSSKDLQSEPTIEITFGS